jgi:nucleosome binding factor SPN SPT16 subunit
VLSKVNYQGQFSNVWRAVQRNEHFETVDVSAVVAHEMVPKDKTELLIMKNVCFVSVDVFNKYLKDQIMAAVKHTTVQVTRLPL